MVDARLSLRFFILNCNGQYTRDELKEIRFDWNYVRPRFVREHVSLSGQKGYFDTREDIERRRRVRRQVRLRHVRQIDEHHDEMHSATE